MFDLVKQLRSVACFHMSLAGHFSIAPFSSLFVASSGFMFLISIADCEVGDGATFSGYKMTGGSKEKAESSTDSFVRQRILGI